MFNAEYRFRGAWAAGCAAIAGIAVVGPCAGCSNDDDAGPPTTPIVINQRNAVKVASEALVTNANLGSTDMAGSPATGSAATAMATALHAVHGAAGPAWQRRLRDTGPANADPTTDACAVSGTVTTVPADTPAGATTVTFDQCVETAGTSMTGTLTYHSLIFHSSDTAFGLTATVDSNVTITQGALSYFEDGAYTLDLQLLEAPNAGLASEVFELRGDDLTYTITNAGAAFEKVALSGFDVRLEVDLSVAPEQTSSTVGYTVASSRLDGEIAVTTTVPLAQITDPAAPRRFPHAGRLLVVGANNTRLQATVLGDESYAPPSGQAQIELQLDVGIGTFGAPIWTSWDELTATAASSD